MFRVFDWCRWSWLLFASLQPFNLSPHAAEPSNEISDEPDHSALIRGWNEESFRRGEKLYNAICITCHGNLHQPGSLPNSRPFWLEPFKNGADPHSIFKTISTGLGQMPAWPWLTPELRYDVIHFIREEFVKPHNSAAYFQITPEYLAKLPKGAGGPQRKSQQMIDWEKGPKYLRMDFGPVMMWTLEASPDNIAYKGVAIRLDEGSGGISRGNAWILYDHDTCRAVTAWTGSEFIDWKGIGFDGSHGTHARIVGKKLFLNPPGPGWANPETDRFDDEARTVGLDGKRYGPLPRSWANYRGYYLHGNQTILSYTVGDASILELPALEKGSARPVLSRTLNISKSTSDLLLRVAPETAAVVLIGDGAHLLVRDRFHLLRVPAAATPVKVKVLIGPDAEDAMALHVLTLISEPPKELAPLTQGSPARWPQRVETEVKPGAENGPFAIDDLAAPNMDANPWNSWMRLTGFDFLDASRAAVCTWNGDVWLVDGLNGKKKVGWRRIAAGLFQPLGLKIVDGQIYVTCRDQIARLRDLNRDEEIDFIESFNHDHQVTEHFHEFAMGLQTDAQGNFYYAKAARHALPPLVPQHGTLMRVSPDGQKSEIVCSGFRAPNGVCVNPDGTLFVTDQEGHWTPKNRVNLIQPGRFYGNMWAYLHPESKADEAMEDPVVWITNEMDRSPGELLWVRSRQWKDLDGALISLSYGTGRIYLVPHETVEGKTQGGVIPLPFGPFPTGVMRGRWHPETGDLICVGMFAWAGNQTEDGGFYRVRRTAARLTLPRNIEAYENGVMLGFTEALDAESASDPANYRVKTWGLRRTQNYGSPHLNEQELPISKVVVTGHGKTVFLEMPDLKPAWCMEIRWKVKDADGTMVDQKIHNTIHRLRPAWRPTGS